MAGQLKESGSLIIRDAGDPVELAKIYSSRELMNLFFWILLQQLKTGKHLPDLLKELQLK